MIRYHLFKLLYRFFILVCSLVYTEISVAQENLQVVSNSLVAFNANTLQEKMFVHTDKNTYVAGEIMWFKIYYIDANSSKPLNLSKIAYVEILDKNNKAVLQGKISLKRGEDNGSFHLPLSLASGKYTLRAYTNLMKNQGAEFFFEKQIAIINTFKNPELQKKDTGIGYTINFFPEGGNLVRGLKSRVAFMIKDRFGKGADFKGYILTDHKDTVLSFSPLKFGIGSFNFTPTGNNNYKAVIQIPGSKIISKDLPDIYDRGYVMSVRQEDSAHLRVSVNTNQQGVSFVSVFAQTKQKPVISDKIDLVNGIGSAVIDKNRLGEGISRFTLFTKDNEPVCERLYFIRPVRKVPLHLATDNVQYDVRKKVRIFVLPNEVLGNNKDLDMSLAVVHLDSLQGNQEDISAYFWLTSELRGRVESPSYYLTSTEKISDEATDNLMLSHGWRRFKWKNILTQKEQAFKFPLEYNGHLIFARVIDTRNNKPAAHIQTFLSIPGTQFRFYVSESDSNGMAQFDVKNYYGLGEVVVQTNMQIDSFYRVDILNPFSETYSESTLPDLSISKDNLDQLAENSVAMQVQNVYAGDSMKKFYAPTISDTLPFYGKPFNTYYLDDYTRFITMEEVFREYVHEINVGVRGGQAFMKIINENQREFAQEDALVLLDGVPMSNRNKIFSYDPLKVKRLDVIPRNYLLGPYTFSGIVSFATYEGNLQGFELDPRTSAVDYEGLQLKREFYSPAYATDQQIQSNIPDFRSTLFWVPDVITDKDGRAEINFYTSDLTGSYLVILNGIDAAGNSFSASSTFEVK